MKIINTNILRILSVILICMFLFAILSACQGDKNKNANNGNDEINGEQNETNENDNSETENIENKEVDYYKNITEELNYDGYDFVIFTYEFATWPTYVDVEEIIGEVLNDAAYMRNIEVSELLGVEISAIHRAPDTMVKTIEQNNSAGESPYDLILFQATTNVSTLIMQNQIYDWNKIPFIDLQADWYNQSANDAFTVNGMQYLAVSDLSYPVQQHFRYLFNKDLCRNLGLDYPYQLVYDGKWTHDALCRYAIDVYSDLNGNGKKDKEDQYGIALHPIHLARSIFCWDELPISLNNDGFVLNIFNDRLADMIKDLSDLNSNNKDAFVTSEFGVYYDMFNAGNALFEVFSSDPTLLRSIETDFGYLPYPKYDDQQKDYITLTTGGNMAVPVSKNENELKRAGAVIEALSAASNKYVADAFVSQYIENKILRDEDSVNMYRLMRSTAVYDRARFFDTTDLLNENLAYYTEPITKGGNLSSQYEKVGQKIELALEKIYETILENQ